MTAKGRNRSRSKDNNNSILGGSLLPDGPNNPADLSLSFCDGDYDYDYDYGDFEAPGTDLNLTQDSSGLYSRRSFPSNPLLGGYDEDFERQFNDAPSCFSSDSDNDSDGGSSFDCSQSSLEEDEDDDDPLPMGISSSYQRIFGTTSASAGTSKEKEATHGKQNSRSGSKDPPEVKKQSKASSCHLPLSSVLNTTTTSTSRNTSGSRFETGSNTSTPFDEKQEDKGASLFELSRRRDLHERPQQSKKQPRNATTANKQPEREPLATKTNAPLDELDTDAKKCSSPTQQQLKNVDQQQLLCVYICVDPNCQNNQCHPPDILRESRDVKKTVKDPSFFYVPVSLIVRREAEMKQASKHSKVPRRRWNGSLLFSKWQEIRDKKEKKPRRRDNNHAATSVSPESANIITCTLHPVHEMAKAQVISPKFDWWQSWLTVCIRAYYNTGTIRVPSHCHGLEILLALEFFGILYGSPDQLVFDEAAVYQKVKQWSRYFTHRATLAQWVVDKLKEQQSEEQKKQGDNDKGNFRAPFVFCTNPKPVKPGSSFSIEPLQKPIIIFEGRLEVLDNDKSSKRKRRNKANQRLNSAQLVHSFFVAYEKSHITEKVDDPVFASPEMMPGMMREDFKSYLQHVLPEHAFLTFALKDIQLMASSQAVMGRNTKKRYGESMRRAVLVVSFNPPPTAPSPTPKQQLEELARKNKAWPSSNKGGGILSPIARSDVTSIASSVTSITNAPTDEMAFQNTVKAVVNLLQGTTQQKLIGDCIGGNESFYFQNTGKKESTGKDKRKRKSVMSPDTTGSSAESLLLDPPATVRSTNDESSTLFPAPGEKNDKRGKERDAKPQASEKRTMKKTPPPREDTHRTTDKSKTQQANPQKTAATNHVLRPKPTNTPAQPIGYDLSSLDTSHIYGGDLFLESIFPKTAAPDAPEESFIRSGSNQSPLWTPSLIAADPDEKPGATTGPAQIHQPAALAPISFVTGASPDHVSVTSSITGTRHPESVLTGKVNSAQPQKSDKGKGNISDTTVQESRSSGGSDRQSHTIACSTVGALFGQSTQEDDEQSGVKKLHDESFEARFDALMREDGEPYKRYRRKRSEELRMQKNLQAAFNDLKFGVSSININEMHKAAGDEVRNEDSCHFLSDMFDLFVPSSGTKPFVMGCDVTALNTNKDSKEPTIMSSTIDSSTVSSSVSTVVTSLSKRKNPVVIEPMVMGLSEENVNPASLVLKLFSGPESPAVPTNISAPANIPAPLEESHVAKKQVVPRPSPQVEDEKHGETGFEVFHISSPMSHPSHANGRKKPKQSTAQRAMRAPMPPRSPASPRGRPQPTPRKPTSRLPPSARNGSIASSPAGAKASKQPTTKQHEPPQKVDKKQNKGILRFLRKK
ncbi:expressed unknown protein [Seminavis robusta]|uniref:Uncharacterized protein n=1 Tax=Seminavis robusta TaxID=568900 RepID=A0A9N8D6U6_9STRA|nr:expressed unknown protein [Seminavis robusta]|eukprot:Sro15_g011370.1 n/a (1375) ;mRNA; f:156176-160385